MTTQPFDSLAPTYDDTFTHTPIGQYLRGRIHARLDQHFHPGDQVLEFGCGTGEDALHLAYRGVRVLATDASESMLDVARAKAQDNPLVEFAHLDLRFLPLAMRKRGPGGEGLPFDDAFSNFGPLNALNDWRPLAAWLAQHIKPGGIVGLGVMGPLCLWETAWHTLHGDFKTAFRRWKGQATFQADDSAALMTVYYPSITRIQRDFAPHFRCIHVEPVGLFLPPSDAFPVIEKRPRLLRLLTTLEDRSQGFALLARFADHYWIEFERVN
jgi:SAM-dependent methyltransferase